MSASTESNVPGKATDRPSAAGDATPRSVESAVRERYSAAAGAREAALCCPIDYRGEYLEILPAEILERDYGCGDPSQQLAPGETVLDLGSGTGKICYIAAQVVGADGQVIGIDMNDDMLALAERHRGSIGDKLGFHNVRFVKGKIQDLALDVQALEAHLSGREVRTIQDLEELEAWKAEQRSQRPLIADDSIDVIVSNCVLNLVSAADKRPLFAEMFRVLRRNGRVVISDIVSDEEIPEHMQADPTLWSGCVSGAFREEAFLRAFEQAGFHGVRLLKRDEQPWQTVEGIEFRSVTVEAFKGKQGPCLERKQAVIYAGPWKSVTDDDGHTLYRGQRMAVCDKTYGLYTREPYAGSILPVEPREPIALEDAEPFDCSKDRVRHARETKGEHYDATIEVGGSTEDTSGGCC